MKPQSYTFKVIFHSRDSVTETVQFFGPDSPFKLFKGWTSSFKILSFNKPLINHNYDKFKLIIIYQSLINYTHSFTICAKSCQN